MLFQVISRNNDPSGNPYRLILVYGADGSVVRAYQARSSRPNIVNKLSREMPQIMSFHVAPAEYKATVQALTVELEHTN